MHSSVIINAMPKSPRGTFLRTFWHYRRLHECFPVQAPDHPDCDAGRRIGGGVPGAGNPAGQRRPDPDGARTPRPKRCRRWPPKLGIDRPAAGALLELGQRHAGGRPGPELRLQHAGGRTGARAPRPDGAAGADGHGHHHRAGAGGRHLCGGAPQQAGRRRRDGPDADRHRHPELLVRHPADPAVLGAPADGSRPAAFPGWDEGILQGIKALLLPAISLAVVQSAILARITRSAVLEVLREDFVRTARAKGVSRSAHALGPRAAQRA